MSTRNLSPIILAATFALGSIPLHAGLIAVYSPPGEALALEDMEAVIRTLRENPEAVPGPRFTHRVSAECLLTPEFSVPAGVSAYFWSDQSCRTEAGYRMEGVSARHRVDLDAPTPTAVQPEAPVAGGARITGVSGASLRDGRLTVSYTLAESAPVTLDAFSAAGRRLGSWHWREGGSGRFERSVRMPRAPGVVMLEWRAGNTRMHRKVLAP
jgi:hypothetical protein